MKVKCLDNFGRECQLTVGKMYSVTHCDGICYWLKNDVGVEWHYGKSRFTTV